MARITKSLARSAIDQLDGALGVVGGNFYGPSPIQRDMAESSVYVRAVFANKGRPLLPMQATAGEPGSFDGLICIACEALRRAAFEYMEGNYEQANSIAYAAKHQVFYALQLKLRGYADDENPHSLVQAGGDGETDRMLVEVYEQARPYLSNDAQERMLEIQQRIVDAQTPAALEDLERAFSREQHDAGKGEAALEMLTVLRYIAKLRTANWLRDKHAAEHVRASLIVAMYNLKHALSVDTV